MSQSETIEELLELSKSNPSRVYKLSDGRIIFHGSIFPKEDAEMFENFHQFPKATRFFLKVYKFSSYLNPKYWFKKVSTK
jgi:hypothetical protein